MTTASWGPKLLCGWPGLAGLWFRGQFSSLLVATGFSVLLNLALISSFLWPRSLGETFSAVAWPTVFLLWATSAAVAIRSLPDLMAVDQPPASEPDSASDTLFIQAQHEYLTGNWQAAEALLRRRLDKAARDIEARLMLATMLRHQRRLDESAQQLDVMLRLDQSIGWNFEIQRERRLLQLIAEDLQTDDSVDAQTEIPDNLPHTPT